MISGCGVEPRTIDDLAIVFAMGVEIDEGDNRVLKLTTSSPTQDEAAEEEVVQTTVKAYGVDGFIRNWQYQRHKRLAIGKIQVMVIGERVIRDNFLQVLQEFREIPEIDVNTRVVFYDGQPQHLLGLRPPEEQRIAIYLSDMIDRNVESAVIPEVTLHTLSTNLLTRGKTAYIPYVEENVEGDRAIIKGLALLDNDGKLATIINDLDTVYYLLLRGDRVGAIVDTKITIEEGKEATLVYEVTRNSTKFDTKIVNGKPEINIRIDGRIEIREISARGIEIIDEDTFQRISNQLSTHLTVRSQRLLDEFQRHNVDPLGLGEKIRVKHNDYFKNDTWEDDYPDIKITNNVNVQVRRGAGFKRTH